MAARLDPKNPILSKLNWLGVLTAFVALVPQVQAWIPEGWQPYVVAAVGVATVILRTFFTSKPTTLTPAPPGGTGG